jgi:hypothetical protein
MKVEKLAPKRNSTDVCYIVELEEGRTVQVDVAPYSSPYFCQPCTNDERDYAMKLIEEFNAANK